MTIRLMTIRLMAPYLIESHSTDALNLDWSLLFYCVLNISLLALFPRRDLLNAFLFFLL